jgi:hypothetical protein
VGDNADIALAAGLAVALAFAVRRFTIFHPAALWLAAWTFAAALFALAALPYRELSTATLLIVVGWTALFCLGAMLGSWARIAEVLSRRCEPQPPDKQHVEIAAGMACTLALLGLGAFLVQVATTYGVRAAFVSDANVRLAIADGATHFTIKYIYVAFAAGALSGVAAARATTRATRNRWIAAALVMIATQYFSTGRSNLLLAALMACMAYFIATPQPIDWRRLTLVGAAVGASTLLVFVGMGSLLGKSFAASDVRTFDNAFVRHDELRSLALPYQYVTAPLPAFDVIRSATPVTGRGGCQTLSAACAIGQKLGLPVAPEPSLTGSTGAPAAWNTFTALYAPMVDGGPVFGGLIIFAEGVLFGLLWAAAWRGSFYAMSAYATTSAAVAYSTVENTLLQPHLVGAALVAVILIAAAARVQPLASARGWRWA